MKTLAISLLVATVPLCGAIADELPVRSTNDVQVVFDSLDRDRDRQISRTEAARKQSVGKRFDGIDSNADGYLSRAEFAARPTAERFE